MAKHQNRNAMRATLSMRWDCDGHMCSAIKAICHQRDRQRGKRETRHELEDFLSDAGQREEHEFWISNEIAEALYCHYHGPCEHCLAREAMDGGAPGPGTGGGPGAPDVCPDDEV